MADGTKGRAKRAHVRRKRAELVQQQRSEAFVEQIARKNGNLETSEEVKLAAAKLYGQGIPRRTIAKAMAEYLCPNSTARTREQLLATARKKLRTWEMQKSFRDLVWNHAVVALDMDSPAILAGVSRSAKRGRVDAARLALEVTGRHTKDEQAVTNVTVQIANVPRPEK